MRFYCLLSLLAVASAFTTRSPAVGGFNKNVVADSSAHRNRQATIVMSGKANGELYTGAPPGDNFHSRVQAKWAKLVPIQ